MEQAARPGFRGGENIAVKMPPGEYERLVAFYRDVVGVEAVETEERSVGFAFGALRLWVDRADALSQGEAWLQLRTDDASAAAVWLGANGVVRRDEIEPLADGFPGFWVAAPGGIIHIVAEEGA